MSGASKEQSTRAQIYKPRAKTKPASDGVSVVTSRRSPTSTANCRKLAGADRQPIDEEPLPAIDHIMKILREGGYHCKLLK